MHCSTVLSCSRRLQQALNIMKGAGMVAMIGTASWDGLGLHSVVTCGSKVQDSTVTTVQ
jgi:hypothetical protein